MYMYVNMGHNSHPIVLGIKIMYQELQLPRLQLAFRLPSMEHVHVHVHVHVLVHVYTCTCTRFDHVCVGVSQLHPMHGVTCTCIFETVSALYKDLSVNSGWLYYSTHVDLLHATCTCKMYTVLLAPVGITHLLRHSVIRVKCVLVHIHVHANI